MVTQSQSFETPRFLKKFQKDDVEHVLADRCEAAVEVNIEVLDFDSEKVSCLNRLAKGYLDLSRYKDAHTLFKKAVSIDPLNRVAIRQLDRLKKLDRSGIARRTSGRTATNSARFIPDPAIASVSELKKVALAETLASVSRGDKFKLKMDESIATVVSSSGDYIGRYGFVSPSGGGR